MPRYAKPQPKDCVGRPLKIKDVIQFFDGNKIILAQIGKLRSKRGMLAHVLGEQTQKSCYIYSPCSSITLEIPYRIDYPIESVRLWKPIKQK